MFIVLRALERVLLLGRLNGRPLAVGSRRELGSLVVMLRKLEGMRFHVSTLMIHWFV